MKLNKRVLASATLSVSLVVPAVVPVAWADDAHVACEQNFRAGSDFDAGPNGNVAEHLQRNCNLTAEQISKLSLDELKSVAKELKKADGTPAVSVEEIEQLTTGQVNHEAEISEATGDGADENGKEGDVEGESQFIVRAKVNDIKAGDRKVTGTVRLYPAHSEQRIGATFPGGYVEKTAVNLPEGVEAQDVPFEIDVPESVQLKAGDEVFVTPIPNVANQETGEGNGQNIVVKAAETAEEPSDNPGDGTSDAPAKPSAPGSDDVSDEVEGSSQFGKVFGVIAGLGGLAALVAGATHWMSQNQDFAYFLQPLRDFLAQFNIKF